LWMAAGLPGKHPQMLAKSVPCLLHSAKYPFSKNGEGGK
jgi:hypothetical protein